MQINEAKLKWQEGEALQSWVDNNGIGTIEACTGSGKTYIAVLAIKRLNKSKQDAVIHVVVPTTKLKEDWVKENGHIQQHGLKNVEVFVINTYSKSTHTCTLLIVDEGHRAAADTFLATITNTVYNFIMCLTATLERLDGKHEIIKLYCPIVHTLTEEDAVKRGFVVPSIIFNLLISLNDKEKKELADIDSKFNTYFKFFNFDFNLAMKCAESVNPRWNDNIKQWDYAPAHKFAIANGYVKEELGTIVIRYNTNKKNQKVNKEKAKKEKRIKMIDLYPNELEHKYHPKVVNKKGILFMHYMTLRKEFVYNLPRKVEFVKEINSKFEGQIITFSESIKIAELIKEEIENSSIYHSKQKVKEKKEAIRRFEENESKLLSSVRALNEGFNVEGAELCINVSQTKSKIARIQKSGRVNRKDYTNVNKVGITVNLCIDDFTYKNEKLFSMEKKTIMENQKGKHPFWVQSVDEVIEIIRKFKKEDI